MTLRPVIIDPETNRLSSEDYAIIAPWWQARGGNAPDSNLFPNVGFIALTTTGEPIACAFAYIDGSGSGVAMLAWMASNPEFASIETGSAIIELIYFIEKTVHAMGYWCLMGAFNTPSIINHLTSGGFQVGDTGMTHIFKPTLPSPWASAQSD